MAEMVLNSMTLSNFKGVKTLKVQFAQGRTDISGRNGSGKTTLVDAFCWVLWNKDSNDNAPGSDAFHEKPLDDNGNEVHYVDTEVELECALDGKPFVLKRSQREHWEKKRGFVDEVYKGNESTYWINGIETKVSDFKARIAEIVPADVFKAIGKLGAFNSLKWQDRRAALLALSGTDVDAALLGEPGYKALAAELEKTGYTVDELRQKLADSRKKINDTLKMLPVRIDEAKKSLSTLNDEQAGDAQYIADEASADIDAINVQILSLENGGSAATARAEISKLEAQAATIKSNLRSDLARMSDDARRKISDARITLEKLTAAENQYKVKDSALKRDLADAESKREKLLKDFNEAKAMDTTVSTTCPTCGKPLDDAEIDKSRAAVLARRKAMMDEIRERGKKVADEIAEINGKISENAATLKSCSADVESANAALNVALAASAEIPTVPNYAANAELQGILAKIDELNVGNSDDGTAAKIAGLRGRIAELKETRDRALAKVAAFKAIEATKARITELEADRKTEGANLAKIEKMIDLVERFVRDRCSSLEESINRRFDNVRWKLFNTQINGGLADCCVCMIPCEAGLVSYECANTASQINADIEIIRNLSDYYGVKLPLFVDNAERVNTLADAGTQVITLSVSTDELKMEG